MNVKCAEEIAPRERQSRPNELGSDAHTKFKIGCGSKADLVSVKIGLRVDVPWAKEARSVNFKFMANQASQKKLCT